MQLFTTLFTTQKSVVCYMRRSSFETFRNVSDFGLCLRVGNLRGLQFFDFINVDESHQFQRLIGVAWLLDFPALLDMRESLEDIVTAVQ